MNFKASIRPGAVFILIAILLPLRANALEFSVGVGLSDGGDENAVLQHEYARLEQDIRALRQLERQLEHLGRQEPPASLGDAERAEWRQQSAALLTQSGEVARLAGETGEYLQESRHGSGSAMLFDYQAAKFKITQRLDAIGNEAKKYAPRGRAAIERRDNAVKLMAATF
ncbi:MAG TPA: hypothetical protein VFX02_11690 [Gammaproteobacteria bacterium]|nr:hypothetical protein [Gammaproteobacteria bacterium]